TKWTRKPWSVLLYHVWIFRLSFDPELERCEWEMGIPSRYRCSRACAHFAVRAEGLRVVFGPGTVRPRRLGWRVVLAVDGRYGHRLVESFQNIIEALRLSVSFSSLIP